MAASAACRAYRNKGSMINIWQVERIKRIFMTGSAVAACSKGLAVCQTDPVVVFVMAAEAYIMHLGISSIGQRWRVAVAVAAACRSHPYKEIMIFDKCMDRGEFDLVAV